MEDPIYALIGTFAFGFICFPVFALLYIYIDDNVRLFFYKIKVKKPGKFRPTHGCTECGWAGPREWFNDSSSAVPVCPDCGSTLVEVIARPIMLRGKVVGWERRGLKNG